MPGYFYFIAYRERLKWLLFFPGSLMRLFLSIAKETDLNWLAKNFCQPVLSKQSAGLCIIQLP